MSARERTKMHKLHGMLATSILAGAFEPAPRTSSVQCSAWADDIADLEDMGALTMADLEDMGAMPRRRGGGGGRGGRGGRGRNGFDPRRLVPKTPGVPSRGARLQPLGFGGSAFTATSGNILALQALPQRPFKGKRLVVDVTRTGATSTGLITMTRLDVGADNQLPSSGALAVSAFDSRAVDVNIELDPATPGIAITLQFATSVIPTAPDRVDFAATMFGLTLS